MVRRQLPAPLPGLLILSLLLGPAEAWAQGRSIRFERLGREQGLSQTTVNCVLQDRTGFLWLGTQDGLNRHDGYRFEVYQHDPSDPATLPADWITALVEDPSGDLWIGTEGGGLGRWHRADDSFSSWRHDPADPASLPGDRVRALHLGGGAAGGAGELWVGTLDAGLCRFDGPTHRPHPAAGTCERFHHDPANPASLSDDRIRAIHQDRAGNLWIGTESGLNRFDRTSRSFVRYRHDPAPAASGDSARAAPGRAAPGRAASGSLGADDVLAIADDHAGALWVGTSGGLYRLARGAGAVPTFASYVHRPGDPWSLSHNRVRAIHEDRDRRLWVGTDGGLNLLPAGPDGGRGDRFIRYRHHLGDPTSLSDDRVMAITQDRGGVLWVATIGGGVNKWDPTTWSFAHYQADPANPGLSSNAVYAFSEDAGGRLWIGTVGGGLNAFDRRSGRFTHYRHDPGDRRSLADDRVTALLHDRDGALWVGTLASGLSRYVGPRGRTPTHRPLPEPPATGTFRHFRPDPGDPGSLSHPAISALFEDRSGELWIGTHGGGLERFDRDHEAFVHHRHDPGVPTSLANDRVISFAEDPGRRCLWIGTYGGGLDCLRQPPAEDPQAVFRHHRHRPDRRGSLSNDTVMSLHAAADGTLWAGTEGGLNRLEGLDEVSGRGIFRSYSKRDGLPSDVIYGIEPDAAGGLWLSTTDGLSRFDPGRETFTNYGPTHGLQGAEFNFGAHYRSPSGELFFGGTGGFNAFRPEEIGRNTAVPNVVFTELTQVNRPVDLGRPVFDAEEIELSHRDYFFDLEFAALDFAAPAKNRYRYKLEGFDDDWVSIGHRRRVTFTNLDPGHYRLRVQGSNNDGVWNEEGATLRIAVAPPPWATWWAWSLYLLAAAGLAGGYVHAQRRELARERAIARRERAAAEERSRLIAELEDKNAELESFNYTVSHDLKNPLITIKNFLGLLRKDLAAGNEGRIEHDLTRIGAAADRMYALLNELLELSRVGRQLNPPQEVDLETVAREALAQVDGVIGERAAEVAIAPLPVVVGDRLRLGQLYQNLIANAVKYMGDQGSPRIEVGVREAPAPVLFVRDNGIGIDPAYHGKVFGLFERLDAGDQGTGIGLALVKRIVEMHGGRVWVESQGLGQGSTFCFTLGDEAAPAPGA